MARQAKARRVATAGIAGAGVMDRSLATSIHKLPLNVAGIPSELQAIPRWLVWRSEPRTNGRLGKVPLSLDTMAGGDVASPRNWASFATAVAVYETERTTAGVGFALDDDDLLALDLDNVRDPDTGDVETWAIELVTAFGSFTEISPSGLGIHIWLRGRWRGLARWDGIEVKHRKGYLTVTGHRLPGTPATIERRQEALDTLADSERHRIAKRRVTDPVFRSLHAGKLPARYPSPSEGDIAFALKLFWTVDGDRQAVERAMRRSDRYRSKWDERRGRGTYFSLTLDKAEQFYRQERRERGLAEARDPVHMLRRAGWHVTTTRATIIRALSGFDQPVMPRELARATNLTEDQVKAALRRLLNIGAVLRTSHGYTLSDTCVMHAKRHSNRHSGAIVDFEAAVARKRMKASDAEAQ